MMKKEMKMLDNGNYEEIVSSVQHYCISDCYSWRCVKYSWENNRLRLQLDDGDPYEDGYSAEIDVKFCPFCGYENKK